MRVSLRVAALLPGIAALAIPASASGGSARPIPNGNYCINCTAKTAPGGFHISRDGKFIDAWDYFDKCAPVPVAKPPKIRVSNGKFSFSGTLKDVTKKRLHYTLKGRFVTARLATGVVDATGGGKSCKAVSFKAKFTRTGSFQG